MPGSFKGAWTTLLVMAAIAGQAQAQPAEAGLRNAEAEALWPRWQSRVLVGSVMPTWRHLGWAASDSPASVQRLDSLSVLGDYYFAPSGQASGFRATSGVIIGNASSRSLAPFGAPASRSALQLASPLAGPLVTLLPGERPERATLPYLGLGYSSMSSRGGWGFSADIGLIARNPGSAVRLGRVLGGQQALDDLLREMRLSPLLNVGVSYAF